MQRLSFYAFLGLAVTFGACSDNQEFKVPETKEEQLELLSAKEREIRELKSQVAQLERASGVENKPVSTRLVQATRVEPTDFVREIELQATVESDEMAMVGVEMPGRITAILVENGDYVKKGQEVARIDVESVGLQIQELETNLALARDIYERQRRLREKNIGTEVQFLEAENNVKRLEKSLDQLRLQQGKSSVKAPISGTVENKSMNAGEFASPGMPLMQIMSTNTVQVVADVPETYMTVVKKGQQIKIDFPTLQETRTARVTEIGRTIDPSNRTFRVELDMRNSDQSLKPNMLAVIHLKDYENNDVIVAGSEVILQEIDGREYVYVAEPQEEEGVYRARKVYVETGENTATSREILSGIKEGDYLVSQGMRSITDGAAISIELEEPTTVAE